MKAKQNMKKVGYLCVILVHCIFLLFFVFSYLFCSFVLLWQLERRLASDAEAERRQERLEQERTRDDDVRDHVL
jgi:cytochrome oxidase assembly protein ShyY1